MGSRRRAWIGAGGVALAVPCLVLAVPLLVLTGAGDAPPPPAVAGIPARVLDAYQSVDGWCDGLRWELLAGIGAHESGHGRSNGATTDPESGEVTPWIFGPPLDGSGGTQQLAIGEWSGWWGLAGPWQAAVGPMQFLPATFTAWAVDHDGDGVANPHDIDDAVAAAANYLCGGTEGAMTDDYAAVLRYNDDEGYVASVLEYANGLASGGGVSILCPVEGPVSFDNTWLAPRPGGRHHHGVDIFAPEGTPVVAPVDGAVELGDDTLGGHAFRLWGDDGNYYYGAHLSFYADVAGHLAAGTVVGYVGNTGDAASTPPHLHFEIHPGRSPGEAPSPIDPTEAVAAACGE